MNDENELLEPLATEAGQEAIVRAIRDISSLEYAVRAELAASTASAKAGEASQSAIEASEAEDNAKDWATKTDTYVEQETITIPPEQEGEEPTTETINLYSAKYYAALALDIYNNMSFDSVPTENSTNMVNSGTVYSALDLKADKINTYTKTEVDTLISTAVSNLVNSAPSTLDTLEELADALGDDPNFATTIATLLGLKADKSDTYTKTEVDTALNAKADLSTTYTKTEVDTALSNVQSTLTFDNVPTANSDNPVKSSGIKTALDSKQDTLTFDSTPTANSTNPVTSGGVYTALQNVNIDIDDEITEDSDNPVTSAAIYEALLNFTPSGGGDTYNGDVFVSGTYIDTNNLILNIYNQESSWDLTAGIKVEYTATQDCFVCGYLANGTSNTVNKENYGINVYINDVFIQNVTHTTNNHSVAAPINLPLKKGDVFKVRMLDASIKGYLNVFGVKHGSNISEYGMTKNLLFSNSSGVNSGTITLSKSWRDFDVIVFGYSYPSDKSNYGTLCYYNDYPKLNGDVGALRDAIIYNRYIEYTYTNNTTITINRGSDLKIYSVYGIKYGRYISGVAVDTEVTEDSPNVITSGAVYDALLNYTPSGGGEGQAIGIAPNYSNATVILELIGSIDSTGRTYTFDKDGYIIFNINKSGSGYTLTITINGTTVFTKDGSGQYNGISCIFKVSKGDIIKVSSNHNSWNVYNCVFLLSKEALLSEQMYSNVLYENSSGWSSGNITLSDSIRNYDFVQVCLKRNEWGGGGSPHNLISVDWIYTNIGSNNKPFFTMYGYYDDYFEICVESDTQLSVIGRRNYSAYKIIGYKMAKGGYSGIVSDARMTVKSGTVEFPAMSTNNLYSQSVTFDSPMPDTNYDVIISKGGFTDRSNYIYFSEYINNATKTVNGFTIEGWSTSRIPAGLKVNWIAIRPNSYTREGMVEDVLFSNASGVDSGTINLSGNISDYDLIEIYRFANDNKELYSSVVSSTDLLQRNSDLLRYVAVGDGNNYIEIYCPTDSSIVIRSIVGEKITKISGIKFGKYVSGVAVDTTVTQNSNSVVTSGAVYDALLNYTPSGGGSSITVDSTITQGGTNPVEGGAIYTALGDKADQSTTYTKTEVDTALASKGDVTTNTDQNITGTKTFVGSKKVGFKQSTANDKLGFTLYGNTGTERGYLEFNPTNIVDGVTGLMTLGNYATSAAALTQVGFRRYSNISGASGAYNLLMPMVADARTPFSLTTSYTNFYLPLGFKNGSTIVKTDKSGVVDLSPLLASLEARIAALEGN